MFANFSFGPSSSSMTHRPQPQPRHAYGPVTYDPPSTARTDSLSPTSSRSTSPSLSRYEQDHSHSRSHIHFSVADLSHKLNAHTLNRTLNYHQPRHHHPQSKHRASRTATPSPPCEADDETLFELDRSPRPSAEKGSRTEANCRRRQRQLHSRLQCDPQHLKALADLVEGMVKAGSQCFVYEAPGVMGTAGSEEGEEGEEEEDGDVEDDGTSTRSVAHKRSVEWAKGRTCVSKTVRGRRGWGGERGCAGATTGEMRRFGFVGD